MGRIIVIVETFKTKSIYNSVLANHFIFMLRVWCALLGSDFSILVIPQVLQYLLDDVSDFLSTRYTSIMELKGDSSQGGCLNLLTAFIDYISERETENFRTRKHDNQNSVTLTTIHQVHLFWNSSLCCWGLPYVLVVVETLDVSVLALFIIVFSLCRQRA